MQSPALDPRNSFARQLFAPLPARYDRLAELLSFGQNGRWRRAMVDRIVRNGGLRPTAAGGRSTSPPGPAGVSLQIAARTGARVIGLDLTEQMLRQGARNVAAAGPATAFRSSTGRAERLPFPDASVRRADLHLPAPVRRATRRRR